MPNDLKQTAALIAALTLLPNQPASAQSRDEFRYWDVDGDGDLTCAEAREGRSGDQGLKLPAHEDGHDGTGTIYEWLELGVSSDIDGDGIACESFPNPEGYIPKSQGSDDPSSGCPAEAETWQGLRVCQEQPREGYDRDAYGRGYENLEDEIIGMLPDTMKAGGMVYTPPTPASRSTSRLTAPRRPTSNTSWPSPRRTTPGSPTTAAGTSPATSRTSRSPTRR